VVRTGAKFQNFKGEGKGRKTLSCYETQTLTNDMKHDTGTSNAKNWRTKV